MLRCTIKDTETGEVYDFETKLLCFQTAGNNDEATAGLFGRGNGMDLLALLLAIDGEKTELLRSPELRSVYAMTKAADVPIESVKMDIAAIKQQKAPPEE